MHRVVLVSSLRKVTQDGCHSRLIYIGDEGLYPSQVPITRLSSGDRDCNWLPPVALHDLFTQTTFGRRSVPGRALSAGRGKVSVFVGTDNLSLQRRWERVDQKQEFRARQVREGFQSTVDAICALHGEGRTGHNRSPRRSHLRRNLKTKKELTLGGSRGRSF